MISENVSTLQKDQNQMLLETKQQNQDSLNTHFNSGLTYNIGDHDSWYIMSNHGKYKAATAHHHTELGEREIESNKASHPQASLQVCVCM